MPSTSTRVLASEVAARLLVAAAMVFPFGSSAFAADPAIRTDTQNRGEDTSIPDAGLARRLEEVHARSQKITSLRAAFEQRKKTPLLKKPMTSTGVVRVQGSRVLWETLAPKPSSLLMSDGNVRIYLPADRTVEVYEIEDRLAQLASSPLPQLPILKQFFVIREAAASTTTPAAPGDTIFLELTPSDPALARQIRRVLVVLDAGQATLKQLQMFDIDGGISTIEFTAVEVNPVFKPGELQLTLPPGIQETYPLGRHATGQSP